MTHTLFSPSQIDNVISVIGKCRFHAGPRRANAGGCHWESS